MPHDFRILVLGGYGHFGERICKALADDATLIVAGRNAAKAERLARALGVHHEWTMLDHHAPELSSRLAALQVNAVVHTCGPFQAQGYHVAQACVAAGVHYVDLADGRAFVSGIGVLDAAARDKDVLVVSGASTLPALSSAVIDEHAGLFAKLDAIHISIAPGQRTPRGVATMESVLSYCGKPFQAWAQGRWQSVYGWRDLHRFIYPQLGARWLARCDVPDLQLFPLRYTGVQSVRFDAALELAIAQWAFWLLAVLVQAGLIAQAGHYAHALQKLGRKFDWLGSDTGGMHIGLQGTGQDGRTTRLDWHLLARNGHGPEIPCLPAIVLARKLAAGTFTVRGAVPCMGLMSLAEFAEAVTRAKLDISWRTGIT